MDARSEENSRLLRRRREIVSLGASGWTWKAIGAKFGISSTTARYIDQKERKRLDRLLHHHPEEPPEIYYGDWEILMLIRSDIEHIVKAGR